METAPQKPATLRDVLDYVPDTYLTPDEQKLLRATFGGPQGAALLKVLRKSLLPTLRDPDLPLEELNKDMFFPHVDFTKVSDAEAKPIAMGLQLATKIIAGTLIQLRNNANAPEETDQQRAARAEMDSAK